LSPRKTHSLPRQNLTFSLFDPKKWSYHGVACPKR
jgi:hypothetical protein